MAWLFLIIFTLFPPIFCQVFGTPKEFRKSKPYHDHVFVFSIVDDHIWFRNYQVRDREISNSTSCFVYLFIFVITCLLEIKVV